MSLDALIAAAECARLASRSDGTRTIEIVVTEIGLVIRGVGWMGHYGADDQALRHAYSTDVQWSAFRDNPAVLGESIRIVARYLDRLER